MILLPESANGYVVKYPDGGFQRKAAREQQIEQIHGHGNHDVSGI